MRQPTRRLGVRQADPRPKSVPVRTYRRRPPRKKTRQQLLAAFHRRVRSCHPLGNMVYNSLVEGALYLVQADDQPTAKADLTQSIARLFTGLRIPS